MNKARVGGQTIEDGDYLTIDSNHQSPENGDVVFSVIDIPPVYIHEDDSFVINGKIIQVIKKPDFK